MAFEHFPQEHLRWKCFELPYWAGPTVIQWVYFRCASGYSAGTVRDSHPERAGNETGFGIASVQRGGAIKRAHAEIAL